MVVDPATNIIEAGGQLGPSMTLDDVESYLEEEDL